MSKGIKHKKYHCLTVHTITPPMIIMDNWSKQLQNTYKIYLFVRHK